MQGKFLTVVAILLMSSSSFAQMGEAKRVLEENSYTCRVFLNLNLFEATDSSKPLKLLAWFAKDPNYEVKMNSEYFFDPRPPETLITLDLQASPNLAAYRKLDSIPYTADTTESRTVCFRQTFVGEQALLQVILPKDIERMAEQLKARKWQAERPSWSSAELPSPNRAQ